MTSVFDAREPERIEAFFEAVDAAYGGKLDILVNVVGGTFKQPFADSSPKGWAALIRANFTWLLHSTHLAIPRMRVTGRGGSIISFTSIEGHRAAPGFAVYAAMKAAVVNFTRTIAVELAPEGIRVNTIAPDMTPTEYEGVRSSGGRHQAHRRRPRGRHAGARGHSRGALWPVRGHGELRPVPGVRPLTLHYRDEPASRWRRAGLLRVVQLA